MKHTLRAVGGLAALLGFVALLIIAAGTLKSIEKAEDERRYAFYSPISPIATPSPVATQVNPTPATRLPTIPPRPSPPYPTTAPTVPPTPLPPTLVPTGTSTVPSPTQTRTAVPTSPGPLPTGLKLVFREHVGTGETLWMASAANIELRRSLAFLNDPSRFGTNVALSHGKQKVAYTVLSSGNDRMLAQLRLIDLGTREQRTLADKIDIGRWVNYPLWSPDDRWIAFGRQNRPSATSPVTVTVSVIDAETGAEAVLASDTSGGDLFPIDWSPDSRYLYFTMGTQRAELWRADVTQPGMTERVNLIWEGDWPRCYFVSPDGQHIICTVVESHNPTRYAILLVPTSPAGQVTVLASVGVDTPSAAISDPIWSGAGQEALFSIPAEGATPPRIVALNIQTRQIATVVDTPADRYIPLSVSPDGGWIVAENVSHDGYDLLLVRRDGTVKQHVAAQGGVYFTTWLAANQSVGQ